jgi:hypothetical protein
MSKLMRGIVLGAMLAVLSSATAVAAQPPDSRDEAVQRFRAGERASVDQPTVADAVEQFRAGERASTGQLTLPDTATEPASGRNDTPVGLLAALAGAAVLSLALDAMLVRRKARKATASTAI